MFVIELTYIASLAEIDANTRAWLKTLAFGKVLEILAPHNGRRGAAEMTRKAVGLIALLALGSWACQWAAKVPDWVLDARRPNVTDPQFLKPKDEAQAPTAQNLLLFIHGIFGDTVTTWSRTGKP